MGTPTVLILLIITLLSTTVVPPGHAQLCNRGDVHYTECDYTKQECECIPMNNECRFCFEIEQRHTFTKYFLTKGGIDIPGYGGRVWYFNNTGELNEFPPEPLNETPDTCVNNRFCTDAHTVDGNSFRSILTINNRFPAPTLIVPNNAIVLVDVYNRLSSEATSIHWHGMHQMNTPWMDGVEHITQCGIAPSSSFRYIFQAYPPGTHWYHSHSGAQRTDGLFGALIVREDTLPNIPEFRNLLDLPKEHTITLIDWQRENSLDLFAQIHAGIRFFEQDGVPPTPEANTEDPRVPRTCSPDGTEVGPVSYWSGLINGLGKYRTVPYVKSKLSVFTVQPGLKYRFRLIGAQSLFAYRFSIDEHTMTVIATDGHFVDPVTVDFIIIHSGERYDFILQAKDRVQLGTKFNFVVRAETLEVQGSNPATCSPTNNTLLFPLYTDHNAEAILHYPNGIGNDVIPKSSEYEDIVNASVPKYQQCSESTTCRAINCPFEQFPAPYGIQCIHIHQLSLLNATTIDTDQLPDFFTSNTLFFNFGFEGDGSTSAINGRNFVFPSQPLQLDTRSRSEIPNICNRNTGSCDSRGRLVTPECLCTHVFDISGGQTYRFVFTAVGPNRTDNRNWNFAHPIHLHGHSFHVAKIGFGAYNSVTGKIQSASKDITCNDQYICTNPRRSNVNVDFGRTDRRAPLKDTVLVPAGGYAVVYFKANNPGYWFLHCHIEVHQLEGMAVVINEAEGMQNKPPPNMPQCGEFTWSIDQFREIVQPPVVDHEDYYGQFVAFCVLFVVAAAIAIIAIIVAIRLGIIVCKK